MRFLPKFSSADDFWPLACRTAEPFTMHAWHGHARIGLVWMHRALLLPLAKLVVWRLQRKAARELEALDDRMLHDIGLTRAEILHVAAFGFSAAQSGRPFRT